MKIFSKIYNFITKNTHKKMSLQVYFYSAVFRFLILNYDMNKFRKFWGNEGEETSYEYNLSYKELRYIKKVSYVVQTMCNKTAWESKCLVKALTAQRLLCKKNIKTTLYLGCGLDDGKMVAHAWLRCGKIYVTGGDGSQKYSIVAKFAK